MSAAVPMQRPSTRNRSIVADLISPLRAALRREREGWRTQPVNKVLEYIGAICGILGAGLLATYASFAHWGWVAFMASNLALIGFMVRTHQYGLLLMQLVFLATTCLGLWRGFLQ